MKFLPHKIWSEASFGICIPLTKLWSTRTLVMHLSQVLQLIVNWNHACSKMLQVKRKAIAVALISCGKGELAKYRSTGCYSCSGISSPTLTLHVFYRCWLSHSILTCRPNCISSSVHSNHVLAQWHTLNTPIWAFYENFHLQKWLLYYPVDILSLLWAAFSLVFRSWKYICHSHAISSHIPLSLVQYNYINTLQ